MSRERCTFPAGITSRKEAVTLQVTVTNARVSCGVTSTPEGDTREGRATAYAGARPRRLPRRQPRGVGVAAWPRRSRKRVPLRRLPEATTRIDTSRKLERAVSCKAELLVSKAEQSLTNIEAVDEAESKYITFPTQGCNVGKRFQISLQKINH